MRSALTVAVVGLGYWGPNLVRNLHALEGCGHLVLCDRDPARLKSVAAGYPGATTTTSVADVAGDDVDAVVVATPVPTHHALAKQLLLAGRSVLVEKPLATSAAEAAELVEIARTSGLTLMAGHTFLYSPPVVAVRELVRRGDIGEPLYVQASRVNLGIHQSEVSVLWDLAPHDLSIILDWLDETPHRVSVVGRSSVKGGSTDVVFVDLEFPSGLVANLHLSWLAPTKVRRMTLVGDRKMVVYEDTSSEEPVRVYDKGVSIADPADFGEYRLTYRTGDMVAPRVGTWEPLRAELEDFLRRVSAREVPDEREDRAVRIVEIIEAAERSLRAGGQPVDVGP